MPQPRVRGSVWQCPRGVSDQGREEVSSFVTATRAASPRGGSNCWAETRALEAYRPTPKVVAGLVSVEVNTRASWRRAATGGRAERTFSSAALAPCRSARARQSSSVGHLNTNWQQRLCEAHASAPRGNGTL